MDFVCDAPFEATLVRSALSADEDDPLLAVAVLKVTYRIGEDGSVEIDDEQLPIREEPDEGELGWIPQDTVPRKPRFDVFALGHARAPERRPVPSLTVRLQVGGETRDVWVFGDRRWVERDGRIVATEPEPFVEMPLAYSRAYGGAARAKGREVPYGYNPEGRGYVLLEEHADGAPLPNVEDPENPVRSWEDQPVPAGLAPVPLASLFTVDRGMEVDRDAGTQRVKPEVFQAAHPRLTFDDVPAGTSVTLYGMTEDGPLAFRMPDLRARVEVELEDETHEVAGRVDTLCLLPDESRFFLLHRSPFKYRVVPEQTRVTRLYVESPGAPAP